MWGRLELGWYTDGICSHVERAWEVFDMRLICVYIYIFFADTANRHVKF